MLKQDVLESLDACTTWQNYTCMYNATMYFKFVLAKKECMKSCQTVNYNVVERVQHMVPSKWVRFVTYNWHRLILFTCGFQDAGLGATGSLLLLSFFLNLP